MLTDAAARAALECRRLSRLVPDYIAAAKRDFPAQRSMLEDRRRVVAAFAGVRSGKTEGGAQRFAGRVVGHVARLMAQEIAGRRPPWRPVRALPMVGDDEPAAHYWIVGPTYELAKVAWRKFLMVLRAAGVPIVRQVEGAVWLSCGVLVERRTGSDEAQLQGARLDGVWVDEVCTLPEDSWDQIGNRLTDRAGWALLTGSPRPGTWPKRRIWDEGDTDDVGLHHWATSENPYIDPDEIERARRAMPAKWFRRDFEATWESDEGLVYDEFAWSAAPGGNLVPLSAVSGPGIRWWGAVDFGIRRPGVLLCATVPGLADDGGEADVVVDEAVLSEVATARIGQALADLAAKHGATIGHVYCDPAGEGRTGDAMQTAVNALRVALRDRGVQAQVSYPTTAARRSIANGIQTTAGRVRAGDGVRRLLVVDELDRRKYPAGLVGICGALRGYRWPDRRPGANEPVKDGVHDHPVDALRYGLVCLHGVAGEVVRQVTVLPTSQVAASRRVAY